MSDLDDLLNEVNSAFSTASAPDQQTRHASSSTGFVSRGGASTQQAHGNPNKLIKSRLRQHHSHRVQNDSQPKATTFVEGSDGGGSGGGGGDFVHARRSSGLDPDFKAGLEGDNDDDGYGTTDDMMGQLSPSRQDSHNSFGGRGSGTGYGGKVSNSRPRKFTSSRSECGEGSKHHDELDELLNLTECSPTYEQASTTGFSQSAMQGSGFTENTNYDSDKDSKSVRSMTSTLQ